MYAFAINSMVHCGSAFEPGDSGPLPYYCTQHVCVPAVIGALAVRRQNNNKQKSRVARLLKQTPSASILFFRTNLLYVLHIEMYRKVGSRPVHAFGTCRENAATQCRLPTNHQSPRPSTFLNRKSALSGRILFASAQTQIRHSCTY